MSHPQQRTTEQTDGSQILAVPLTDIRELSMVLLRQGRHVEVLEPKELRDEVVNELQTALKNYGQKIS
jgi:predicted DNA-binding transcriptional regulator YafY